MSNLIITSRFKIANRILYVFGILFISFLSVLSFSKFNSNNLATYPNLATGSCFTLFSAYILYYLLNLPKINIYTDKIELYRFFGLYKRTLFLNEINSWLIQKKENKYGNYEFLYLTLNKNEMIKFNSYDYANFEEVRSKIIKNKPKNIILKNKLKRKEGIKLSIILTLLGILLIYIGSQFYKDTSLTRNDVQVIKGTLSEDIKLERGRKSKSLVFKLENLSDFKFKIGSLALKETYYEDLMSDLKKGNEIYLTTVKDQYEKKISKKKQMSFLDKYFHYQKIDIVEVQNKGFTYLSLSDYNKTNRENDYWGIGFFGIFGLFLAVIGICIYPKTKKTEILGRGSQNYSI